MRLSDSTYDTLKYIAQIVLPALATLYATLAQIWSLPFAESIPLTIMAVDTFMGILLKISTDQYWGGDYDDMDTADESDN